MKQEYQIRKLIVAADYQTSFLLADRRGQLSEKLRGILSWPEYSLGFENIGFRNPDTTDEFVITPTKTHYTIQEPGILKTEKELSGRIVKPFSVVFKTLKMDRVSRVGARFDISYSSKEAYDRLRGYAVNIAESHRSFFGASGSWELDRIIGDIRIVFKKGPNEISLVAVHSDEVGVVIIDLDFSRGKIRATGFRDFVRDALRSLKDIELVLEGVK